MDLNFAVTLRETVGHLLGHLLFNSGEDQSLGNAFGRAITVDLLRKLFDLHVF